MNLIETIRNWILRRLHIEPAQPRQFTIQEELTFEDNAALNRIWYKGDASELSQVYQQLGGTGFWSMSAHAPVQRIHTGIPGEIADTLAQLVTSDLLDVKLPDAPPLEEALSEILDKGDFHDVLEDAIAQTLVIGDGVFRLTLHPDSSSLPVIGFVPGDRVQLDGQDIVICTAYRRGVKEYLLRERYGFGYIRYELTDSYGVPQPLGILPETAALCDIEFDNSIRLAVLLLFSRSHTYPGRGRSIFDRKRGSFDALDEAWSQWMHAVRKSQVKTYVPEALARYDGATGAPMHPDDFTDNYILVGSNMAENGRDQITSVQPQIEHEGYLAAYITALDLALQGLLSPSTLGIDVKKLDNAEAQREKEKATLYTRARIVQSLQKVLPELFRVTLWLYGAVTQTDIPEALEIAVNFGEYANPSFEAQVETLGKAKQSRILSNEALVEELWGDAKTDQWKAEECARLNGMDGLADSADEAEF